MSVIEADLPVQTPQLSWQKKLAYLAIIWVVVLGALACFGEVMLRVLPLGRFRSLPFRRYDPNIGLALIPNRKVSHNRGCFSGVVETNSFGWRDRERTLEKPSGTFRIAMLGDSYVEAVHVKPEEVVNIQLEKLLREQGYNAEVLNFGIEGIGSTQELLVYEQKARQFHPDVVLMMYTWNDIMNNSSVIQPEVYGIHTWYAPYYDLGPDGNLVLRPVQRRWFNDTQTWLEEHSVLVYYLERIWQRVNYAPAKWEGVSVYWGV